MSRVGQAIINIPDGVEVKKVDDRFLVKGSKGELSAPLNENVDVIINEKEIRHEMRDRISKLNELIPKLSKEMKIENLIVTRGSDGSILYNSKKRKFIYAEAYASKVIDKIGAGDTMLSVISLCLKSKIDIDLSLIISSLAAAQSVENLANKDSISKLSMWKTLENILK